MLPTPMKSGSAWNGQNEKKLGKPSFFLTLDDGIPQCYNKKNAFGEYRMKKILLVLAVFALLFSFSACSAGIDPAETEAGSKEESVAPSTTLEIVQNGKSQYDIVHDGTKEAKAFSSELSSFIKLKYGATLETKSSSEGDGRYEIQISSSKSEGDFITEFDFSLSAQEDRLHLSATSPVSFQFLLEYLKREVILRKGTADLTITPENDFQYSNSPLAETNFVDYLKADNKTLEMDQIFESGAFRHEKTTLLYRYYIPSNYSAEKKYPIFVNLHGAGLRGSDNKRPLSFLKKLFQEESYQLDEYIVIVPQCPEDDRWVDTNWGKGSYDLAKVPESNELAALVALIEGMKKEYSVDESRIYAAGFSMGGYGTWNLLMNHPDLFAAGVPMCGAASPSSASLVINTPIWAVHGVKDPTVPVSGTREMVAAIQNLGGTKILYTELPNHEHDVWTYTYGNEEIFTWLFSQKLG